MPGPDGYPEIAGFEILEEIGTGGMGTVYRARQAEFQRQVALKLVHRHAARDEEFRERFRQETRIAASLQHPNIVPVYAAGESGRDLFMAMMLVPGSDLATIVGRDGPMTTDKAVAVIGQVASALDEAHRQRLIHRDVKPQNVIVDDRTSHAYLTDFGIARSLDATVGLTQTGHQVGTIEYMSPEQLDGKQVDHRTDIYSLSCLLYGLVTGRRPFEADSMGATIRMKLAGPSSPSLSHLGFHRELSDVVERAQAVDPNERYSSAGEFAAAANAAVDLPRRQPAPPAAARTQPVVEVHRRDLRDQRTKRMTGDRSSRSGPGHRLAIAGASLAALVLVAGGAGLILLNSGEDGAGSLTSPSRRNTSAKASPATEEAAGPVASPAAKESRPTLLVPGAWSGSAEIYYDDGRTDSFTQSISITSLVVGQQSGTSTAVQGSSTCTGPITLLSTSRQAYRFAYSETNTDECIDESTLILRPSGDELEYRERTDVSLSAGTLRASDGLAAKSRSWPSGESGWAVVLAADKVRSNAEALAASEGVGVLVSSRYPDLTPGYWVVFVGPFSSESAARSALSAYAHAHPDAYVRYIDGSAG